MDNYGLREEMERTSNTGNQGHERSSNAQDLHDDRYGRVNGGFQKKVQSKQDVRV
jgi:hypothetical protein